MTPFRFEIQYYSNERNCYYILFPSPKEALHILQPVQFYTLAKQNRIPIKPVHSSFITYQTNQSNFSQKFLLFHTFPKLFHDRSGVARPFILKICMSSSQGMAPRGIDFFANRLGGILKISVQNILNFPSRLSRIAPGFQGVDRRRTVSRIGFRGTFGKERWEI